MLIQQSLRVRMTKSALVDPNARGQQEYERILDAVLNGGQ
jgi:hypothetical protein